VYKQNCCHNTQEPSTVDFIHFTDPATLYIVFTLVTPHCLFYTKVGDRKTNWFCLLFQICNE